MDLLSINSARDLLRIDPSLFKGVQITEAEMAHLLEVAGSLWLHPLRDLSEEELRASKNPGPHAGLSAGGCSTGYLDTLKGLSFTPLAMLFAQEHARRIRRAYSGPIDWVVGSDHAAATYSAFLAFCLGARHDFTSKFETAGVKGQKWDRHTIGPDEIVLRAEELSTTGSTPEQVTAGVDRAHPYPIKWAPVSAFAVNRTGSDTYDGNPIIELFRFEAKVWKSPEVCPLCAAGSLRVAKPKLEWEKLTGHA